MSEFNEEHIKAFITDFWNDDLKQLNPDDVFGSLSIDGDDAFEFMENYAETFNVNMGNYRWYFHNGEEGWSLGALFFKPPYARAKGIPITLKALIDSANAGNWTLSYPQHSLPKRRYDILINQLIVGLALLLSLFWLIKKVA